MDGRRWRLLVPAPIRRLPADLAAVVASVGLAVLGVFAPVLSTPPLRVIVGLPFVLFAPGYAIMAALFPEANEGASGPDDGYGRWRHVNGIERVALSIGVSLAVVPLIGLVLHFTPWGIRLIPVVVAVSVVTLVCTAVAAERRWALPVEERFRVPYRSWLADLRTTIVPGESRFDTVLAVFLVVSVVIALVSVAYAVSVPKQGEVFTELYLLTETEEGDLVAGGYPETVTAGEAVLLVVGVGNHEHEPVDYTVVVQLHRATTSNDTVRVEERAEVDRLQLTLAHNETRRVRHEVRPSLTGRVRLVYLLYRGDPPGAPTVANSYRNAHIWFTVHPS